MPSSPPPPRHQTRGGNGRKTLFASAPLTRGPPPAEERIFPVNIKSLVFSSASTKLIPVDGEKTITKMGGKMALSEHDLF